MREGEEQALGSAQNKHLRDLPELWSEQKLHGFGDPAMNDSWERVQCDAASLVASICT